MAMYCGAKLGELPKFMMMVIFLKVSINLISTSLFSGDYDARVISTNPSIYQDRWAEMRQLP
ncbi:hypothetical protein PHIN10_08350 [Polynucleobacter sp. HIN10]|nr:hypothetical protein PHIN10_08350 [Polynucleobacter sp. HIN10]